ncbi:MAG: archaellin/type IV pilin N-terminal domain-containing protein [Candidatus Pacearchaeota archaeon]
MKKGVVGSKKGLSPVIATVLLIMLVLILAALIFLWARGIIGEQIEKNGRAIKNVCSSVNFEVELVQNSTGSYLEAINRGSVAIYSFDLKMIKGGDSSVGKVQFGVDVGESISESINENLETGTEKMVVYPVLIGNIKGGSSNKPYTCTDMGRTLIV